MPSILIVCTANICRSPMAEAILKRLVAKRPDAREWHIASAGTWANYYAMPATLSQEVMRGMGMDISAHQSQPVTAKLIKQFDIVLTMERRQKEGLILQFPQYKERIFMLSEMAGRVEDVPDPILGKLADYQVTARLMKRYLSAGLNKMYRLSVGQEEQTT